MCRQKSVKAWPVSMLALGFNLLIFAVLLLLFEPTPKSDDYDMAMILYGGYTGEYSPYMLYCNTLLGKVIQGLMQLCPVVSWYYVLQYIGMLIAFSAITYVYIKKSNNHEWVFPCLIFLLFCGYECYIRITFTKTAGILIIAGLLSILYQIESKNTFGWKYFCGIGLIFWGILVRSEMYRLTAAVFAAAFVIFLLEHRKIERRELRKWGIYFIAIIAGLWMTEKALVTINKWQIAQDAEWQVFSEVNGKRARLSDYGWPEFEKYKEEYTKLGVSANDIELWKRHGDINDREFLTPELMDDIRTQIPIGEGKSLYQKLDAASKGLLNYYLNDTGIYLFLLCGICLGLYRKKDSLLIIGLVSGGCVFAYYYMRYLGRLQHHVDVSVLIAGAALLLYYLFPMQENRKMQKHLYVISTLVMVVFILKFYVELTTSSYYGASYGNIASQKEHFAENKEQLSLLSEDEEHLYLFGAYETNWIYDAAWSVTEVVSPGFYHNLYMLNRYEIPDSDYVLKNYGIKNVYKEITNSNVIYFTATEHTPGQIEILCQYIREHYCPEAYYTLVKQVGDLYIYRFTEGDVKPEWTALEIKSGTDIQSDINVEFGDSICRVSGYAFVDGTDSYAQNIYLCVSERSTGKELYAYTLQSENEQFAEKDKYHGRYSAFSGEIALGEDMDIDEISVYLYLDTGKDVYCIKTT